MSAEAARTRSAVFFIQYLALLAAAALWVQFDVVHQRVGRHLPHFYVFLVVSVCYVLVRAYLVLGRRIADKRDLWIALDLLVITGAVYLTGGLDSEAALLYFWPISTSAIQRMPRRTIAISVATGVLYFLATWPSHLDEKYPGAMMARFVVLFIVCSLAVAFAMAETVQIEEMAKLREQARLSEYRAEVSREMHDGIQRSLADIALRLELARKLTADDVSEAARLATDQRFAIRQTMAELRHLIRLLQSPTMEGADLVARLRYHVAGFAEGSPTSASLETEGEERPLPPEVAQTALRIAQEAMTNAEKHAQATELRVTLRYRPDSFACIVRDNGVGFDPAAPRSGVFGGGFGLPSMAQRAEDIGGEVRVTSAPGQGTEVAFTVPLTGEAEAASTQMNG